MADQPWEPKKCPDCDELIKDEGNWASETQGSGSKPGVCLPCAKEHYWPLEDDGSDFEIEPVRFRGVDLDFEDFD